MNFAKETMCTHCKHREVCGLKEQYLLAMDTISNVTIPVVNESWVTKLSNISWIKPVVLDCIHYS